MNVLVIAPHPDDEVLGCGGTIAKRTARGDSVAVCIVSTGQEPLYPSWFAESESHETEEAHKVLGVSRTITLGFPSAMLDKVPQYMINEKIAEVIDEIKPESVYIPHRGDVHRDHQIVADAAMVAVRPNGRYRVKSVYAYETMSETDWNTPSQQNAFIPNVYEDITWYMDVKICSMQKYASQIKEKPAARSAFGLKGLAAHRGAIVGVSYAEAFALLREVRE